LPSCCWLCILFLKSKLQGKAQKRKFVRLKFASIDIGSNAVRLLISRWTPENADEPFKRIEFVRVPLRLGDDAFREKEISREKKKMLYKAMEAFRLLMDVHDVNDYMACATSAMRESRNGQKIVDGIREKFDLKIEIISGKRESELILSSVRNYFPENGNYLTIDVGGGSTEMTIIEDHVPLDSVSFDLGTVRLLDKSVKEKTWEKAESWVKEHTSRLSRVTAIGTSGTMNKLYRMGQEKGEAFITFDKLKELHSTLRKYSVKDRIEMLQLNPDRADVIEHSAYIYLKIMKWAGCEKIYAPSAGLKDGMLLELARRYTQLIKVADEPES
jgi:exopolyphosphatase / guanosine-5'-triphosphate,3'-diphosphate pyrophosphatase